jgi:septin family protein
MPHTVSTVRTILGENLTGTGTYYIVFWFRLTVVDTPGFGDAIDNSDSFQQIIRYIDDQFARYRTIPYLSVPS